MNTSEFRTSLQALFSKYSTDELMRFGYVAKRTTNDWKCGKSIPSAKGLLCLCVSMPGAKEIVGTYQSSLLKKAIETHGCKAVAQKLGLGQSTVFKLATGQRVSPKFHKIARNYSGLLETRQKKVDVLIVPNDLKKDAERIMRELINVRHKVDEFFTLCDRLGLVDA